MSINHNCERHGCFVKNLMPDWDFLKDSFRGKGRIGDIDGIIEKNGHLLILEWKSTGAPLPEGQEIMFTNATRKNLITVFVIWGNPTTTTAERIRIYQDGEITREEEITNEILKGFCKYWESRSLNNGFEMVA